MSKIKCSNVEMAKQTNTDRFFHRMKRFHNYYRRTGFYKFLLSKVIKLIFVILAILGIIFFVEKYVVDINTIKEAVQSMHTAFVLVFFLATESLLGLIPPDIFIAWAERFAYPYLMLTLLGVMSYLGGIISYKIGRFLRRSKKINTYLEQKFANHFYSVKRWGGLLIIIAALLPLPFSTICMAAGAVKYPFRSLLLFGLTRFLRFYVYGAFIFKVILS